MTTSVASQYIIHTSDQIQKDAEFRYHGEYPSPQWAP